MGTSQNHRITESQNYFMMNTSRGERNNNPLNIRRSADRWEGASQEQTDNSFVQFKSLAYGYRAAWKILQSYYDRFASQGKGFTVTIR